MLDERLRANELELRRLTAEQAGLVAVPAGERPPDLTIDEMTELARHRLRDVIATRGAG